MKKNWISLGLMSGTSGDGVDASLIKTNGLNEYKVLINKYFEYDSNIYRDIHTLKEKIHKISHLERFDSELNDLERKITIFHAEIIKEFKIDDETIVGFHGQTIYHNFKEKISRQLGNGKLLAQLTKKKLYTTLEATIFLMEGKAHH